MTGTLNLTAKRYGAVCWVANVAIWAIRSYRRWMRPANQDACPDKPAIFKGDERMKVGQAAAEIMKRGGIEILCGYPVSHLLEFAAAADIRPIIVRQERIGLHMADAISRVTSGRKIGAFCMQHGPGTENAYGGVAQAYSESISMLVLH